jgi:hypothetical protein
VELEIKLEDRAVASAALHVLAVWEIVVASVTVVPGSVEVSLIGEASELEV